MPLPHIDDRLAGLAEAATTVARPTNIVRRPHPARIDHAASSIADSSADQLLELVGSVVEAIAVGDVRSFEELVVAEVHVRSPASDTTGVDEYRRWTERQQRPFSVTDIRIEWLVAGGLGVAAEWHLRATHLDRLDVGWATIEATGQSIALEGALVAHLDADTVASGSPRFDDVHLHYDSTDVLVQLALT